MFVRTATTLVESCSLRSSSIALKTRLIYDTPSFFLTKRHTALLVSRRIISKSTHHLTGTCLHNPHSNAFAINRNTMATNAYAVKDNDDDYSIPSQPIYKGRSQRPQSEGNPKKNIDTYSTSPSRRNDQKRPSQMGLFPVKESPSTRDTNFSSTAESASAEHDDAIPTMNPIRLSSYSKHKEGSKSFREPSPLSSDKGKAASKFRESPTANSKSDVKADVFPAVVDSLPKWSVFETGGKNSPQSDNEIFIDGLDATDPNFDKLFESELANNLDIFADPEAEIDRVERNFKRRVDNRGSKNDDSKPESHVMKKELSELPLAEPVKQLSLSELRKRLTMKDQLPEHLDCCRGCGANFQTDAVDLAGYVPQTQYEKYKERIVAQLNAARHDLRIRSGGGKGIGTAVAAVHASLSTTLNQVKKEIAERGSLGTYSKEKLEAVGLDEQLRPLPTTIEDAHDPLVQDALDQEAQASSRRYNTWLAQKQSQEAKSNYDRLLNIDDGESTSVPLPPQFSPEQAAATHRETLSVVDVRQLAVLKKVTKESTKPMRCLRCHQLANGGVAKGAVAAIRAEDFMRLLQSRFLVAGGQSNVIIKLVDVFDFHGSFIQNFKYLAGGRNPIFLVANKFDLLPKDVGVERIKGWIARESERYGLHFYGVHVVSSQTGFGIEDLMRRVLKVARGENSKDAPRNRNIYVVGSTNVGKSTFVNALIKKELIGTGLPTDMASPKDRENRVDSIQEKPVGDKISPDAPVVEDIDAELSTRARGSSILTDLSKVTQKDLADQIGEKTAELVKANTQIFSPLVEEKYLHKVHQEMLTEKNKATTSPIPGTTLGMVSYPVLEKKRGGKALKVFDTPGVINAHQATAHLHYEELRAVLPTAPVRPLVYRIEAGQSLLIGGLVRVDYVSGRPYSVSTFFAPRVSVHVTRSSRITPSFLKSHTGSLFTPPFTSDRAESLMSAETLGLSPEECEAAEETRRESKRLEAELGAISRNRRKKSVYDRNESEDYFFNMNDEVEEDTLVVTDNESLVENRDDIPAVANESKETPVRIVPVEDDSLASLKYPARSFLDSKGRIIYQLQGAGWKAASHDIAISGLGWISITGAGAATFRIAFAGDQPIEDELPMDQVGIDQILGYGKVSKAYARSYLRDPLMPWENQQIQRFHGTPIATKMISSGLKIKGDQSVDSDGESKLKAKASKVFDLKAELELSSKSDSEPNSRQDIEMASRVDFKSAEEKEKLGLTPSALVLIKPKLVRALYRRAAEMRAKAGSPHDIIVPKLDLMNGFVAALTTENTISIVPKKIEKGGRRAKAAFVQY